MKAPVLTKINKRRAQQVLSLIHILTPTLPLIVADLCNGVMEKLVSPYREPHKHSMTPVSYTHLIARAVSAGGISGGVAGAVAGSAVAGKRAERKNTASKDYSYKAVR